MSQELISAISRAAADPITTQTALQNQHTQLNTVDLKTLGGATIQAPNSVVPQAPSAMNLQSLAGEFSNGLQNGFYTKDVNRLLHKMAQSKDPRTGVTAGDITAELLNVQAKVGIADAFSKVSSKISEGLQTMVVKQG
jgi:hypothetical protein